jgi:non-ribosomal peptide synthetase component F
LTFGHFSDTSKTELLLLRSHRTYALDTVARYPKLSVLGGSRGISPWLIVAQLGAPQQDCLPPTGDKTTGTIAGHQSPTELTFQIAADGLSFGWVDNPGALKREQIEQMGGQFLTFLKSCLTAPDLPLRALPLLPEEQRSRLQAECNEQAYG